jgi:hypothetical protein
MKDNTVGGLLKPNFVSMCVSLYLPVSVTSLRLGWHRGLEKFYYTKYYNLQIRCNQTLYSVPPTTAAVSSN